MIWNDLGYTRNIYFREPLSIDSQANNLLCGRDFEIEVFLNDCFNDNKCLKVISGDVGIGKTSFVNACQFISYNPRDFKVSKELEGRILPSYKKIELSNHDHINSFSIKAVISLTTNINSHFIKSGVTIPDSIKEYIDYWNKIAEHPNYDDFWQKRNLLPHLKNIKPAILIVGGWYDAEDLLLK